MWAKVINFAIDLIQKPHIKQLSIIFFNRYSNAVCGNVVDQYIAGPSKDSQYIICFPFFEIYSVILHKAVGHQPLYGNH
jgi:hypothetical protein